MVEGIPCPIVVQCVALRRPVAAHPLLAPAEFVDVVADVHYEVKFVRAHVPVRRVVAVLILLTGSNGDAQPG
jgi:hypothetical protein